MSWREALRRVSIDGRNLVGASFRGVTFFVETVEVSGGRRVVVHEFPLRDKPFVEDLGRGANGFRVDGYVLGDEYIAKRDALLDALLGSDEPGELVLPSYPASRAVCVKANVRESRGEGGISMISIEFAEAPLQSVAPTEVVDGPAQVATSADAANTATDAELAEQFDADDMPSFALDSAETALINAAEALQAELAPLVTVTQELAELTGRIAILTARASSLVRDPAEAIAAFREVIDGLVETVLAAPGAVMNALCEAYLADLGTTVVATTSTRARELTNQTALTGALRRVLAIEAARLAPLVPYESIDEAILARDTIGGMLEEQAADADDTAYPALVDLRSQVLRAVPGGAAFASVVTVTRNVPIPSTLLTYQLYGSVDNEADVIARNGVRHPGFVAGELRVLGDV